MNNIIKFYSWNDDAIQHSLPPEPAVKRIPKQWKAWPAHVNGNKGHLTVKHCMPFFDAMTAGYHYLLPCDVKVSIRNNEVPSISWDHPLSPLSSRSSAEIPSPIGHYDAHFSWQMWWGMALPEGWSVLITNPINHHDLPFTTTSGIADYDKYTGPGNIGFFIKKGFEGVIPSGTPIFQIIPIKRENWVAEVDHSLRDNGHLDHDQKIGKPSGFYKKNIREDKLYK